MSESMMIVESNDNNDIVVKEVNDLSVTFEGKFLYCKIDIINFNIIIYLCLCIRYMFINSIHQERS